MAGTVHSSTGHLARSRAKPFAGREGDPTSYRLSCRTVPPMVHYSIGQALANPETRTPNVHRQLLRSVSCGTLPRSTYLCVPLLWRDLNLPLLVPQWLSRPNQVMCSFRQSHYTTTYFQGCSSISGQWKLLPALKHGESRLNMNPTRIGW